MLAPQKYSERLGVIDPGQLHEVAERFDLGEIVAVEAATRGLFGQNLFLSTTEGEFVLRGNPHGHVQLTKERRVAEFLKERSSLPVPWPYEVDDDAELFGWTYAILPRLPGSNGTDLWESADADDRVALSRATGEALTRMHEATSDFFGPYDAQLDDFIAMDDFSDWALHRFEHWRNMCRAVNSLSTEGERYIDSVLDECASALAEPFVPVLVHHDFKLGNLNLDPDDFEPTGVFDLMEAYLADGEEDIVRMLWTVKTDDERRAFVDAYTTARPFRPGSAERLALYSLCDWMVIWEYGKRVGGWFEGTGFVESAKPIVDRARALGSSS
jgi:hygromycin-B 7''-O-kinase